MKSTYIRLGGIAFFMLWVGAVALGMRFMVQSSASPGSSGQPAVQWPEGTTLRRQQNGSTLVMVVHPRCACTGASLEELSFILSRTAGRLRTHILFLHPRTEAADWHEGASWKAANRLPDANVVLDENGREAAHFGSATSGHVLLYSRDGRLLFSGGITSQGGHSGANAGRSAVLSLVNSEGGPLRFTSIFGCSLIDPEPRS